jgi:hypothetical protein
MFDPDANAIKSIARMEARALAGAALRPAGGEQMANRSEPKPLGLDDLLTFAVVLVVGVGLAACFVAAALLGIKGLGALFSLVA